MKAAGLDGRHADGGDETELERCVPAERSGAALPSLKVGMDGDKHATFFKPTQPGQTSSLNSITGRKRGVQQPTRACRCDRNQSRFSTGGDNHWQRSSVSSDLQARKRRQLELGTRANSSS